MILPPIERCILKAADEEGYREIIGKPLGEYSLLNEIKKYHENLSYSQTIPSTNTYPTMTVIDLVPCTSGFLSDSTTCIVVAPFAQKTTDENTKNSFTESPCATGLSICNSQLVSVCLLNSQCSTVAFATEQFLDGILASEGSLVSIGRNEYRHHFVVKCHETQRNHSSNHEALSLYVGEELFRNIRSAYTSSSLNYEMECKSSKLSSSTLRIPLNLFQKVYKDGVVISLKDNNSLEKVTARKISVSIAFSDFFMQNILGPTYRDIFTVFLKACVSRLNHRFISEGDVLILPITPGGVIREDTEGVDSLESILAKLSFNVRNWNTLSIHDFNKNSLRLPIRVFEIAGESSSLEYAYLDMEKTEWVLVSQPSSLNFDATPLYAPCGKCELSGLDAWKAFRSAVEDFLMLDGDPSILVVHSVKENEPYSIIEQCLLHFGIPCIVASLDVLGEEEKEKFFANFLEASNENIPLVIRNAERLWEDCPQMVSFLDSFLGYTKADSNSLLRLVILVYESIEAVPPALAARCTYRGGVIDMTNPSESDRKYLLESVAREMAEKSNVAFSQLLSFESMATWTVGLTVADIRAFLSNCFADVCRLQLPPNVHPVLSEYTCEAVLQRYMRGHGHNLVSTKLQPVRWSDVGGLEDAKQELKQTIQMPLLYPHLFSNDVKKKTGILFYGPPGCGKTLLAKAVATEMNMNFMSVKGPELINQYVGESEKNIRLTFQRARDNSPCIIFFDELDALAPARGAKGDGGGAMDRIVSQLLVEVDGIGQTRSDGTASGDVFIIGATNRPDLLDPSLLRPGRFDTLCYLGIPSTKEEQLFAVQALTRKFNLDTDVDLKELIAPLDFVYTGADFFALCSDAMMFAVDEVLDEVKKKLPISTSDVSTEAPAAEEGKDNEIKIKVKMSHFLTARNQLKPSVSATDLKRYESLKTKFK